MSGSEFASSISLPEETLISYFSRFAARRWRDNSKPKKINTRRRRWRGDSLRDREGSRRGTLRCGLLVYIRLPSLSPWYTDDFPYRPHDQTNGYQQDPAQIELNARRAAADGTMGKKKGKKDCVIM